MNAKLQWSSHDGRWGLRLNGNNIFNNKYDTRSLQGNQDYRMKINYSWASVSFAVIYKFGGYKEKNIKKWTHHAWDTKKGFSIFVTFFECAKNKGAVTVPLFLIPLL